MARWLKAVGDSVSAGEPVVEVTTDKVDVEVSAPAGGRLAEIVAAEGATVAVGATLGMIVPGIPADGSGAAGRAGEATGAAVASPPPALAATSSPAPASTVRESNGSVAPASPLARRAAALRGIDLGGLAGSGPAGLVRRADVELAVSSRPRPSGSPPLRGLDGGGVTPLTGAAAALVDYMEQSREIPTATSFRTVAVGILEARRHELNIALSAAGEGTKVSFTHLIGHAVAVTAGEMPIMASHFDRDGKGSPIRVQGPIGLGLAVDSRRKDGSRFLVVPVIHRAADLDFAEFRAEYERLVGRARTNSLTPDEMRGAALTLTNPGGIGTVASVPRLMAGQGTIIAVGAIDHPPEWQAVSEGRRHELGISKVMTMSSTYDHRVIQGAESGEFLGRIAALLAGADGFYERIWRSLGLQPGDAASTEPKVSRPPASPQGLGATAAPSELLAAVSAAMSVVKAHRTHGHLGAHLDPLGSEPIGDPSMDPLTVNLTPDLMEQVPAELLRVYVPGRNLAEILPNLRRTYCGTIAYEIEHISSHEQRVWLREHIESGAFRLPLSAGEKLRLLSSLTRVDAMERYLRRTYVGQKTFSGEGIDVLIPMLETLMDVVAGEGVSQVVMGMSHRARLAVIAHVVNLPYESVLAAFEKSEQREPAGVGVADPTGDVKYHIGAMGTYLTESERQIAVRLLPNPSHLEAVDAVVEGWARADQTRREGTVLRTDSTTVLPVLIHGDAAFSAQGVVAEVLNLQSLSGYTTGGTIHFIANNQIGFTTTPAEGRSTRYASDLAKGFDIPIVHVNADDVEACVAAVRLACDYRRTYHRDVVIDVIGYRRFGHNEADEPTYTQPVMYQKIHAHSTVRELFIHQLAAEKVITEEAASQQSDAAYQAIADAHARVRAKIGAGDGTGESLERRHLHRHGEDHALRTGVDRAVLLSLNEQLLAVPPGFNVNPKFLKQMTRRRATMAEGGIDWGTAESLAFASLLVEGHPVRLTGQDTERGTFSQRHLVLHDIQTGQEWVPMHHLGGARTTFELHNSPLSEVGCVGFEYGYSAATPHALVVWEAQFGDFVNNAQMIIDQFISSGTAKWNQRSRLTLLLPHGYEGAGPEHSSARLERFLQLAAHGNMRVANCSTSAQYFHLIRSQALVGDARPLVVMTPKSLLRRRESGSTLDDLVSGAFQTVIDDPNVEDRRQDIHTLLLCTGKIYYELVNHPLYRATSDLAIGRLELLDPLPIDDILSLIAGYPRVKQVFWVQEEPSNMGAWLHLARPIGRRRPYEIRWDYIGRPRRASPSEGFAGSHHMEQERIVTTALSMSREAQERLTNAATKGDGEP